MRHLVSRRTAILSVCVAFWGFVAPCAQFAAPQQAPAQKLSLKDAEALALRNHPLLQAAHYDAEAASQMTREQKSAYYPTASGVVTGAGALPEQPH